VNRDDGQITKPEIVIQDEFRRFLREEGARDRWGDFADGLIERLAEAGWSITPRCTDPTCHGDLPGDPEETPKVQIWEHPTGALVFDVD
jgi:hypothetical protein